MVIHFFEYGVCLLVLTGIVFLVDRRYPMLRDFPTGDQVRPGMLSFSLGRVQMAGWTIVVVASLIYAYWIAGTGGGGVPTIDPSIVGLLGISGATGVLSGAVDVTKDKTVENTRTLFAESARAVSSLDAEILAALTTRGPQGRLAPNLATIQRMMQEKAVKIGELARQRIMATRSRRDASYGGFISDLLSDQNGNSLHRLQIIFFSLVFGAYFVCHVATTGDLKIAFSQEILGLMGVSSGVYVGFKIPGKAV